MQLHRLGKSLFGKAALASAALSGILFLAGVPGTQAADRDDGDRRSVITERHYFDGDRGYYNRQAENWRDDRREAVEHRYRDDHENWDPDRDHNRYHRDRDRDDRSRD
jgi:hypothetical protein